jgi:hypothetical protein
MTATLTGVQLVMAPSARYSVSNLTGAKAAGMAVLATMACGRAFRQDHSLAGEEIGGHDVHRDSRLFQIAIGQMRVHELVEAFGA